MLLNCPFLLQLCLFFSFFHLLVVHCFLFPSNITCYCNNKNVYGSNHRRCINNRCNSQNSLVDCYVQKIDEHTIEKGCTFHPICVAYRNRGTELKQKIIHCCRQNFCNENLNGTDLVYYNSRTRATVLPETRSSSVLPKGMIIIIVLVPLTLLFVTVFAVWKQYKKVNSNGFNTTLLGFRSGGGGHHYQAEDITSSELSSGTGAGCQLMVQQTISSQISLKQCINKGRFGALLYRGKWYGTNVCVKIYFQGQRHLWCRECLIYQTALLRHENILGFVAADSKESGTLTEHWLICDYHPKGSLYNYIQTDVLCYKNMIQVLFGLVSGLNYLHSDIVGSSRRKPKIAHGALKTKHLIMKNDYTCCIADLSAAVTKTNIPLEYLPLTSTTRTRYHSPELLNNSINFCSFDSYLKADIYALGICIWELCWRTKLAGISSDYRLPLFEYLPPNASGDDILNTVFLENNRPNFPDHWHQLPGMELLMNVMRECWCSDASARLPALRIKKYIASLLTDLECSL